MAEVTVTHIVVQVEAGQVEAVYADQPAVLVSVVTAGQPATINELATPLEQLAPACREAVLTPQPATCPTCVHRVEIPWNCHIGCRNLTAHPVQRRWRGGGEWPLAFDPATVVVCAGHSTNPADRLPGEDNPALDLFRLLSGVGRL